MQRDHTSSRARTIDSPSASTLPSIARRLRALTLASVAILSGCGGGSSGSSPAPAIVTGPGNSTNPIPAPAAGVLLGAWALPNGAPSSSSAQDIAQLEAAIGRKFALSLHYDQIPEAFPSPEEAADLANGRIPIISLDCNDTDYNIAHGSQDSALVAKANAIKSFGEPVFLRYKWEFNLLDTTNGRYRCADPARDAGGYWSPTWYVAAYRHIHDVMAAQGATNIAWIWNPSAQGVSGLPYYPGDAYVDWVGIDDYDRDGTSVQTYTAAYGNYAGAGDGGHPVIIDETGAVASDQVALFTALPLALETEFNKVKALVYFDAVGPADNYSLTPAGLAAFASFALNPYLSAAVP